MHTYMYVVCFLYVVILFGIILSYGFIGDLPHSIYACIWVLEREMFQLGCVYVFGLEYVIVVGCLISRID